MSYTIHRNKERGLADHGWLHSRFSFSFAEYYNPQRMGFGALRVINDDIIEAGEGFPMHPHKDMEIISVVTKGSLEHHDSQGNHGVINKGQIQYMSAGSGVHHSEYNPSQSESVELFQVWIHPNKTGGNPLYDERDFNTIETLNEWIVLASGDGREHSIKMKQDALISTAKLESTTNIELPRAKKGHGLLLFVIEGTIEIAGEILKERDEMQIINQASYTIKALSYSHLMLFEVPMHQ